jgi:hypothetical protein
VVSVHRVVHSRRRAHCPGWPACATVSEVERLIGRREGEPVGDVGEARLRVHVDGARIHRALAHESSGPDSDHPGEALARVLKAWQANELSDHAHIWRATDPREVDHQGAVLLVRRPDRRVHLVGAGGLGEHLRQLLRGGVDGWRLHELPVTQTPLNDAEPLLGPRVYAMLARYGFTTVEEIAAVPDLGLLDIRHFGPKTRLVVDAVLAAYRLVDDPALRAAQERRRHHITSRLSAAHRARNAALLDLLAISDLEIGAVDTILESLAAEVVAPADPRVLQLLGAAGQPELVALYARTRTPAPLPGTDGPRGSSHDCHTSSGDTGRDGDVSNDC